MPSSFNFSHSALTVHVITIRVAVRFVLPRLFFTSVIMILSFFIDPYFSRYFRLLIWTMFRPFLASVDMIQFSNHLSYIFCWISRLIEFLPRLSTKPAFCHFETVSSSLYGLSWSFLATQRKNSSSSRISAPNKLLKVSWNNKYFFLVFKFFKYDINASEIFDSYLASFSLEIHFIMLSKLLDLRFLNESGVATSGTTTISGTTASSSVTSSMVTFSGTSTAGKSGTITSSGTISSSWTLTSSGTTNPGVTASGSNVGSYTNKDDSGSDCSTVVLSKILGVTWSSDSTWSNLVKLPWLGTNEGKKSVAEATQIFLCERKWSSLLNLLLQSLQTLSSSNSWDFKCFFKRHLNLNSFSHLLHL